MMSNNDLLHQTISHEFLPLMADFHFLFVSWNLHLNEVFSVCCFARFESDYSSIRLMYETAERFLSRTDFRWWSTATFYGNKISMHFSRCQKNIAYHIDRFCKIFENYAPLCVFFFQNYVNYALRAELCDVASTHNSGSPDFGIYSHSSKEWGLMQA